MSRRARRRKLPPNVLQLNAEESEPVDRATEGDRIFFETHPGVQSYRRAYVPGEFYPAEFVPTPSIVEVRQIIPGVRARTVVE